jgi:hypothetical protein
VSDFRSQAAFTIAELIIAMGLTIVVAGAVLAALDPARVIFQVQPEVHDLQQRLRVAVEAVHKDLLMAGAGPYTGPRAGPLHHVLAPIMPYRAGEVGGGAVDGVFYRPDAMSVISVPSTAAQALIESVAFAGERLAIGVAANCGPGAFDRLCGFDAGTRVLLFDGGGRFEFGTVVAVDGRTVMLEGSGLRGRVGPGPGAMLTEVSMHTYFGDRERGTGVPRLMHYDGRLTELPVVDHVVAIAFEYFADPAPPLVLADAEGVAEGERPSTTYGPAPPPVDAAAGDGVWGPGENCVFVMVDGGHVARLPWLAAAGTLVRIDPAMLTDGPWCPDAFDPNRFDADLLRVRRVSVTVRVEAADDALRGPRGREFFRGGLSTSARTRVPDQALRFDVSPRNMNLVW